MKIFFTVVVLVILGAGAWVLTTQAPENGEEVTQEEAQEKTTEGTERKMTLVESLQTNPDVEIASLLAVDESNSLGAGYRLVQDGMLQHAVVADMPDPVEGSVYEGWLVQTDPLNFFSTGVMEKGEDGTWVLEYTGNMEYPTHLRVVITEETVVDETPERHVIEGDF